MIAKFTENEETIFCKMVERLSCKLGNAPRIIKQSNTKFHLDTYARTFTSETGKSIYPTAKESDLLYFLFMYKGQVFMKEHLYENIWGYDYISDAKNLTSFIRKLRKKIEPFPDKPQYLLTVWGVSYEFNEEKA